jgi:hypothetical protein
VTTKNDQLFGYALDRTDETWWNCKGETRDEAAAYAFAQEPDATKVYICNQIVSNKAHLLHEQIDTFLDQAEEAAGEDEQLGHHEDNVFDHSFGAKVELERCLNAWLAKCPGPRVWTTIGSTITEHERLTAESPVIPCR